VTQQNATFLGVVHPGGGRPQIRTRPRFLYDAPTPKFRHPMFTRSEVIVLTNKSTNHPPTNKQRNRCHRKHPMLFAMLQRWVTSACRHRSIQMPM